MMRARLRLNHALMAVPRSSTIYGPTPIRPDSERGSAWLVATASAAASRITAGTATSCRVRRSKGFNRGRSRGNNSLIRLNYRGFLTSGVRFTRWTTPARPSSLKPQRHAHRKTVRIIDSAEEHRGRFFKARETEGRLRAQERGLGDRGIAVPARDRRARPEAQEPESNLGKGPRLPARNAAGKTAHQADRSGRTGPRADAREYAPARRSETDRILATVQRRNIQVLRVGSPAGARRRGDVHHRARHHRAQKNGDHGQPAGVPAVEKSRAIGLSTFARG